VYKISLMAAGMVIGLERGANGLYMVQVCIWSSCCHYYPSSLASLKSRIVLPFWCQFTQAFLEKRTLNGVAVVVVVVVALTV